MPSRTKAIKSGVKFLWSLYGKIGPPLLLAESTNFEIVIPKKTTSCVVNIVVQGTGAFHTWNAQRRDPSEVKKSFTYVVYQFVEQPLTMMLSPRLGENQLEVCNLDTETMGPLVYILLLWAYQSLQGAPAARNDVWIARCRRKTEVAHHKFD